MTDLYVQLNIRTYVHMYLQSINGSLMVQCDTQFFSGVGVNLQFHSSYVCTFVLYEFEIRAGNNEKEFEMMCVRRQGNNSPTQQTFKLPNYFKIAWDCPFVRTYISIIRKQDDAIHTVRNLCCGTYI